MMRTVEIVGGGVAGLSLAVGLRNAGVPVALFESRSYPRHRTCGEFIHGLDRATAVLLGIEDTLKLAKPRDRVSWFWHEGTANRWRLRDPALVISRHKLDAALAEKFLGLGGRLETGSPQPAKSGQAGRVFATGRRPDPRSGWVGFKIHYAGLPMDADLELHVGHRCYVGVCALSDGRANVCGLFRLDKKVRAQRNTGIREHVLAGKLYRLAERLDSAEPVPESLCAVAGMRFGVQPWEAGRVAIGDAHAVVPPYSGQGMAMALQAAGVATPLLKAWSSGGLSWEETALSIRRGLENRFARRFRRANGLHPFLITRPGAAIATIAERCGLLPMRRFSASLL